MNLNHLLYFRILAQTENYTEAAKRLLISQPSLTYAMKKLEGDIGVPLFEKTGRNVQLTEYGRELQKTTEEAYRQLTQTTNQMRMRCQQELTTLKIGIIPTLASDFIPEVIRRGKETGVLTEEISLFHGFTSFESNQNRNESHFWGCFNDDGSLRDCTDEKHARCDFFGGGWNSSWFGFSIRR